MEGIFESHPIEIDAIHSRELMPASELQRQWPGKDVSRRYWIEVWWGFPHCNGEPTILKKYSVVGPGLEPNVLHIAQPKRPGGLRSLEPMWFLSWTPDVWLRVEEFGVCPARYEYCFDQFFFSLTSPCFSTGKGRLSLDHWVLELYNILFV